MTTEDNEYQREQLAAAEKIAREFGAAVKTIYAKNDVFEQSQQLLETSIRARSRRVATYFSPVTPVHA